MYSNVLRFNDSNKRSKMYIIKGSCEQLIDELFAWASVSKRVFMGNLLDNIEFDWKEKQENKHVLVKCDA